MHVMARPSTLTPEIASQLCAARRVGATLKASAGAVGVPYRTLMDWLRLGRAEGAEGPYADLARGLDAALVKQLTGGDTIAARFMGRDFFEFRPTHTLWVSTNHRPVIRESGNGIWRRVVLVPWTVTPPAPDTTLPNRVRDELPGVLRWIVEGCLAWQREGLAPPDAVMAATAEYRDESDVLGSFLAERTTTEPEYAGATARVAAGALFKAYQSWCLAGGLRPDSQTAFGRELTKRGFAAQAGGGGANFRMGLRLIAADEATGEGVDGF